MYSLITRATAYETTFVVFRLLCLDALVEEGDLDEDYRLRFGEFSRIMAADFVPSNKREF